MVLIDDLVMLMMIFKIFYFYFFVDMGKGGMYYNGFDLCVEG